MERREQELLSRVIRSRRWAALGTLGNEGPLASMAAYAWEPDSGGFLLLLSNLSLHTRNLLADPRASLAISEADTGVGNPQTLARVSIQGEAAPIERDSPGYAEAKAMYEKRLPASAALFGFGDFVLFRFAPREARFVAGFARAYTLGAQELKEAGEIQRETAEGRSGKTAELPAPNS